MGVGQGIERGPGPRDPRGGLGAPAKAATGTAAEVRGSLRRRPAPDPVSQKDAALSTSGRGLRGPTKGAGSVQVTVPASGGSPRAGATLTAAAPGLPPASFSAPISRITLSTHESCPWLPPGSNFSPLAFSCLPLWGPHHRRGAVSPPSESFLTHPHVLKCRFQGSGRNWSSGSEGLGNLRPNCLPPNQMGKTFAFRNTGQGLGRLDKPSSRAAPSPSPRSCPPGSVWPPRLPGAEEVPERTEGGREGGGRSNQ